MTQETQAGQPCAEVYDKVGLKGIKRTIQAVHVRSAFEVPLDGRVSWDNRISSVKVRPTCALTLYDNTHWRSATWAKKEINGFTNLPKNYISVLLLRLTY